MKTYVVGFMFDRDLSRVSLIKKNKPEWQAGKFNGIGGKIEEGETAIQAMVREFQEEAGVFIGEEDWKNFIRIEGKENGDNGRVDGAFSVDFFCTTVGNIDRLRCMTEEEIEVHFVSSITRPGFPCLENIPWVVGLAVDFLRDGRPTFTVATY